MSTFLKCKVYEVKSSVIVECAKVMAATRNNKQHFLIGSASCLITELLFLTYFQENRDDPDTIYSDQYTVCRNIQSDYVDIARLVVQLRNKFAHEFGSSEYYELYNVVVDNYAAVQKLCHFIGGLPTKKERDYLVSYFNTEQDSFYSDSINWFTIYSPIGYRQLVAKLEHNSQRSTVSGMLKSLEGN